MAASQNSQNTLAQGFSIYQPALGAQLQFFPAVGTQQLDDMVNAYVSGPASTQEKRATVSLDFLEYSQVTGESFKFYPVFNVGSVSQSPVSASPVQDSVSSSFNASPVTPNWDWSQATTSRPAKQSRKASTSASASRHQPTDFSHLPGMQIMTKDGRDVTNSASRGSKSKEQRDHAHLMRVIKACEACRRRKTRCDPSHKKRTAVSPQAVVKTAKKAKTASQPPAVAPSILQDESSIPAMPFDMDSSFALTGFEDFDFSTVPNEDNWEQFLKYPEDLDENYDFFLDPKGYLSPEASSFTSSSSSSSSPLKSTSPTSQQEGVGLSPTEMLNPELQTIPPSMPFLDQGTSAANYTDFNLYSPQSSFSEDDLMIDIQSSSGVQPSPDEQLDPGRQPPTRPPYGGVAGLNAATAFAQPFDSPGSDELISSDYNDGSPYYDPGRQALGDATGGTATSLSSVSPVSSRGGEIDLAMRVMGEASAYANGVQARETVNDSPSSSSGRALGQTGPVIDSPSSSSGRVLGQTGPVNHSQSSSLGPVLGQAGTESTAATAALRVEDERDLSWVRRVTPDSERHRRRPDALVASDLSRATTVNDAVNAGVAMANSGDQHLDVFATDEYHANAQTTAARGTVTHDTSTDMNVVPAALATIALSTRSSSVASADLSNVSIIAATQASILEASQDSRRGSQASDDQQVEHDLEPLTSGPEESTESRSAEDTMTDFVISGLDYYDSSIGRSMSRATANAATMLQNVVEGCQSTTSTMATLSSMFAVVFGLLTLTLSAMDNHGINPSAVFAWATLAVGIACVTASRSDDRPTSKPLGLDLKTRESSEADTNAHHGKERRARSSSPTLRSHLATLRSEVGQLVSSPANAASAPGYLLAF